MNNDHKFYINSSTGSDTQASGLGQATAVYGSTASVTGGSSSVSGIDTTGITAGDVIWVDTSSGRQFNEIVSVDSSTEVTCDRNWDTSEYATNWASGGKRATLQGSQRLLIDSFDEPYDVVLEEDQTITSQIEDVNFQVRLISDGTRRVITHSSSYFVFGAEKLRLKHLKIKPSTTGLTIFKHDSGSPVMLEADDVIFGDSATTYAAFNDGNILYDQKLTMYASDCQFVNFTKVFDTRLDLTVLRCYFDVTGDIVYDTTYNPWYMRFEQCVFNDARTVIYGNPSATTVNQNEAVSFSQCIFNSCGSGFIYFAFPRTGAEHQFAKFDKNVLISCQLGTVANVGGGATNNYAYSTTTPSHWDNTTTLSTDPVVNSSTGDLNIADTTAGETLRALKLSMPNNTDQYHFRNLVSDDFGGDAIIVIED